jgi:hypothetical protein
MSNQKRDDGIRRRDFINGMLIAAGTAAVGGSFPMRAMAGGTTYPCDGAIGTDPNVLVLDYVLMTSEQVVWWQPELFEKAFDRAVMTFECAIGKDMLDFQPISARWRDTSSVR